MQKLKQFIDSHPKLIYEIQSFFMTFIGVYVSIVGISENTTIQYFVNNKELFIGSIGLALSRTIIIYVMRLVGFDYRQQTAKYQ